MIVVDAMRVGVGPQVCVASACDFFPESTDMESLLGAGISPSAFAKRHSCIDGRIDDFETNGTPWDTCCFGDADDDGGLTPAAGGASGLS